jgi:hypothetical protein
MQSAIFYCVIGLTISILKRIHKTLKSVECQKFYYEVSLYLKTWSFLFKMFNWMSSEKHCTYLSYSKCVILVYPVEWALWSQKGWYENNCLQVSTEINTSCQFYVNKWVFCDVFLCSKYYELSFEDGAS